MAGSYNHAVDKNTGKLLNNLQCVGMAAETGGDAYETIEEMYGMIWHLATDLERASGGTRKAADSIEWARAHYRDGLALSPGTDGALEVEE